MGLEEWYMTGLLVICLKGFSMCHSLIIIQLISTENSLWYATGIHIRHPVILDMSQ